MITYSTLCNEFSQVNAYFAAKVYGRKGSIICVNYHQDCYNYIAKLSPSPS